MALRRYHIHRSGCLCKRGFLAAPALTHRLYRMAPAVSCYYVENPRAQLCATSHVWTLSKFLGTSVACALVGQGTIHDVKHDEEYLITYPTAYGMCLLCSGGAIAKA